MQTVFGLSSGEKYERIKPLLVEMVNFSASPVKSTQIFFKFLQLDLGAWSPWGKYIRSRKKLYDLLQSEIEAKRANPEKLGDDILSLMISARDEEGQPIADDQLKDELITLLIAGHDTTATSLAWAFYWLEKLPEVKEKLLQEIDSLGENPDPIAISRSPYLTAVCQETLRLVIATIISKYQLALANNKPIKPIRRGATIAPSNGVPLVMTGLREVKKPLILN